MIKCFLWGHVRHINPVKHKFNLKADAMSNGLEKYMAFFLGKDSVFIDST